MEIKQLSSTSKLSVLNLKQIATLIYQTDNYIYPALFSSKEQAQLALPILLKGKQDIMFSLDNIYASFDNRHNITGIILWHNGAFAWNPVPFLEAIKATKTPLSENFDLVKKEYFDSYAVETSTINIINCCTMPECRNTGIGSKLFEEFINEHSSSKMELLVLEHNVHAISIYKKNAFKTIEKTQGFSIDKQPIPCLRMIRHP